MRKRRNVPAPLLIVLLAAVILAIYVSTLSPEALLALLSSLSGRG